MLRKHLVRDLSPYHAIAVVLLSCPFYHAHFTDEGTEAEVRKMSKVGVAQYMAEKRAPGPNSYFLALHRPENPRGRLPTVSSQARWDWA